MNIEQRIKRLEEKVSGKKVTEDVDELYVIKMATSRKLSEISSLMKRTSLYITKELRELGYSDQKLQEIAEQLKIDSIEYEDLI